MLSNKQKSVVTMAYLNGKSLYIYSDLSLGLLKKKDTISIISECSSLEQMMRAVADALWFYSLDEQA